MNDITRCMICHRPLTDETSVRMGVGSDCRAKMVRNGWKFPKPRFKVRDGHSVLIGFTGKVEAPVGHFSPEKTEEIIRKIEKRLKGKSDDHNQHES